MFGSDFFGSLGFACGGVVNKRFVWQKITARRTGPILQVLHKSRLSLKAKKTFALRVPLTICPPVCRKGLIVRWYCNLCFPLVARPPHHLVCTWAMPLNIRSGTVSLETGDQTSPSVSGYISKGCRCLRICYSSEKRREKGVLYCLFLLPLSPKESPRLASSGALRGHRSPGVVALTWATTHTPVTYHYVSM